MEKEKPDSGKTGALIASARREKGLTQRQLAEMLHVSDRAVSKWERSAGFPDVSLLVPLADALDLQVLDLLRGERGEIAPEPTARQLIALLLSQARGKTRRRWGQIFGGLAAMLMVGAVVFAVLDRSGVFLRPVVLEVEAEVYAPTGEIMGETIVTIDGEIKVVGQKSFVGRFAIGWVEPTCREGVQARIRWDGLWPGAQDILFYQAGEFLTLGVEQMLYITEGMASFGFRLADGTIIATDVQYVPLLLSGYYYTLSPVFANQF